MQLISCRGLCEQPDEDILNVEVLAKVVLYNKLLRFGCEPFKKD